MRSIFILLWHIIYSLLVPLICLSVLCHCELAVIIRVRDKPVLCVLPKYLLARYPISFNIINKQANQTNKQKSCHHHHTLTDLPFLVEISSFTPPLRIPGQVKFFLVTFALISYFPLNFKISPVYLISCNFSFYLDQAYLCTFAKITLAKAFLYLKILLRVWGHQKFAVLLPALPTNYICILDVPVFKIPRHYCHRYFSTINFISGSSTFCLTDRQCPFLDYATAT